MQEAGHEACSSDLASAARRDDASAQTLGAPGLAGQRRTVVLFRGAVLALLSCSLLAAACLVALGPQQAPLSLMSSSFPGGTLFGGPANWDRFLAAGGMVAPASSGGSPAPGSPVERLQAAVPRLAPRRAAMPAAPGSFATVNYGSPDASQLWPSAQQLASAIYAAGGSAQPSAPPLQFSGLPAPLVQAALWGGTVVGRRP